jgi:hypothetical protein
MAAQVALELFPGKAQGKDGSIAMMRAQIMRLFALALWDSPGSCAL